jgi:hypothetical protein
MRDGLQLRKSCWACLLALWSASAWAAATVNDLSSISFVAVAVAVVLAVIGGAAATLQKLASPEIVVKSILLEVCKDTVSSVVAGLVTYSLCAWQELPMLLQPACITMAGYGGSRVLERYLAAGMSRIDRLGGKPEGKT